MQRITIRRRLTLLRHDPCTALLSHCLLALLVLALILLKWRMLVQEPFKPRLQLVFIIHSLRAVLRRRDLRGVLLPEIRRGACGRVGCGRGGAGVVHAH
jgi:hypothetical protein